MENEQQGQGKCTMYNDSFEEYVGDAPDQLVSVVMKVEVSRIEVYDNDSSDVNNEDI